MTEADQAEQADGAERAERFRADVERLRAKSDSAAVERRLLGLGVALMALGILACVVAYFSSTSQTLLEDQNESIVLAVGGAGAVVAGAALFLRYSLGRLLRIWLLRLLYEIDAASRRRSRED